MTENRQNWPGVEPLDRSVLYDKVLNISRTDAMINLLTEFNRNRAGIVEGLGSFMQEINHTILPFNEY